MIEEKSVWSAVTCHPYGPWRPDAMLPPCSICARVSLCPAALRQVAVDQSADSRGPRRGSRTGVVESDALQRLSRYER
jgi:hypothetical protein